MLNPQILNEAERQQLNLILRPDFARNNSEDWPANNAGDRRVLLDAVRAPSLYHVQAQGLNVTFRLIWGQTDQQLEGLIPPFTATTAGQLQLFAQPIDTTLPAWARATIARVYGACCLSIARKIHGAGDVLQAPALRCTALVASQITPPGLAAVALAPGASFPIVPGAIVTSGTVVVEYAI